MCLGLPRNTGLNTEASPVQRTAASDPPQQLRSVREVDDATSANFADACVDHSTIPPSVRYTRKQQQRPNANWDTIN